ncbi:MAG TPA: biopolymer transporter ExbD [Planctomycetota bacterium]
MSKRSKIDTETQIDMTPMIDMVFLMIIFFIIVNDLSQQELEELKLPVAITAVHDDPPDGRPILNVLEDGTIIWKKKTLFYPNYDPAGYVDPIRKGRPDHWWFLAQTMRDSWLPFMEKTVDPDYASLGELPDEPVLIRADRNTPWKHISKIMEVCSRPDIKIWKVQLAAAEDTGS